MDYLGRTEVQRRLPERIDDAFDKGYDIVIIQKVERGEELPLYNIYGEMGEIVDGEIITPKL